MRKFSLLARAGLYTLLITMLAEPLHAAAAPTTEPQLSDAQRLAGMREVMTGKSLPVTEKLRRIRLFCMREAEIAPTLTDAKEMSRMATSILTYTAVDRGVELDVWGDNDEVRERLSSAMYFVGDLFARAEHLARSRAAAMKNSKDEDAKLEADGQVDLISYCRNMAAYYAVQGVSPDEMDHDSKGAPQRLRAIIGKKAINNLRKYDNPDSGVQPSARLTIARLMLATDDVESARKLMVEFLANKPRMDPSPNSTDHLNALWILSMCDLRTSDFKALDADKLAFDQWLKNSAAAELKATKVSDASVAQTMSLFKLQRRILDWRICLAKSRAGDDAAYKEAGKILSEIRDHNPKFSAVIDRHDPEKQVGGIVVDDNGNVITGFGQGSGKPPATAPVKR